MTEEEQKLNWYAILESGSMTAVHNLREYIKNLEKENTELEAQIEKMKCCANCKYKNCGLKSIIEEVKQRDSSIICEEWELVE